MTRTDDAGISPVARHVPLSLRWETRPFWAPLKDRLGLSPTGAAIAVAAVKTPDWISYSRANRHYAMPSRYRSPLYTWRAVVGAVEHLGRLGLIDHDRRQPGQRGLQSTFRARAALAEIVSAAGQVDRLQPAQPRETVWLRERHSGDLRDYRDTRATEAMRRTLDEINCAVATAHVEPPATGPIVRIFNDDWRKGGRFYALGEGTWQTMRGEARRRLKIDGHPVVELDFRSMHPALLYAEAGAPMPADCYALPPWPRPLVKLALLVLLNATTEISAQRAIAWAGEMADIARPGTQAAFREAAAIVTNLKRLHAPIARHFGRDVGMRLMAKDAAIAESVMAMMLAQGIVALPIHDSFLVAAPHKTALETAMIEAARRHGAALLVATK